MHKAALLCKADLTTDLVKEFTELQGIIGGLYAKVQDLDPHLHPPTAEAIGDAIYHHYQPESMDDDVPPTVESAVLAIADKADTIAGMFALGLVPTGSKDPFALRRAANGIVKIVAEHKLPLPIGKLFSDARAEYAGTAAETRFDKNTGFDASIAAFMRERLEFYLRDFRGFAYDVVNAVLAAGSDDVVDAILAPKPSPMYVARKTSLRFPSRSSGPRTFCDKHVKAERKLQTSLIPRRLSEDSEQALATRLPEVAAEGSRTARTKELQRGTHRDQPPSPAHRRFL